LVAKETDPARDGGDCEDNTEAGQGIYGESEDQAERVEAARVKCDRDPDGSNGREGNGADPWAARP
jgi:hypothetical protein